MSTPLRPSRIASKLDRLKMVVAYARVMKNLREAAKHEDTSVTENTERPQKRKGKKR
jgi:hypothetical protein